MIQAAILILSGSSIWLIGNRGSRMQRRGYILGLAAQPFWAYSAWKAEQWGILLLTA